ncbi:hypothetical protein SOASR030_01670 [Leminorella grimontii]|uniref:DUF2591 domain-containing protein n=1 Tax=Leminorella grimontii TaxID=82981 RepID=A0AAV5MWL2_9GAMM|nr:DUF2591 family protein [Leminorella grimontii]KFC95377.1 hypothetical protein GLGR_1918 [Leminorella grimontii ATCC 33999 = DSM 5078]GKX54055.1 hypothetical protein SOASR030_01670 [Leminorella grimontii]VFS60184.1 Protein of uncharacterised function (DUF2591) [Leminorella grimontii]
MREIGEQINAGRAVAVIYETFGHLDAKPGERHKGWFVFINGQHGDTGNKWAAQHGDWDFAASHENPLRAAMIVFLMMHETS